MQVGNHTILYNRTGLNLGDIEEAVRVCLDANAITGQGKIRCLNARMEYNANTQQFSATSVY